jgi:hypothetical protein
LQDRQDAAVKLDRRRSCPLKDFLSISADPNWSAEPTLNSRHGTKWVVRKEM